MPLIVVLIYNLVLITGTCYLIVYHNWSMWTFVLTFMLLLVYKEKDDDKEKS